MTKPIRHPSKPKHSQPTPFRPIIVANWKMQLGTAEATALARQVKLRLVKLKTSTEAVVCPSFLALESVGKVLQSTAIRLGAQNVWGDPRGAYTGEISPLMLQAASVSHVIIGHSERRQLLHEDEVMIAKKMVSTISHGLTPILCVGETGDERAAGKQEQVVNRQLHSALRSLPPAHHQQSVIIAYEPVWAIGTGITPTSSDADEMRRCIRQALVDLVGSRHSDRDFPVLYGGSVTPENVSQYVGPERYQGALVGTASLKAQPFVTIITHVQHQYS